MTEATEVMKTKTASGRASKQSKASNRLKRLKLSTLKLNNLLELSCLFPFLLFDRRRRTRIGHTKEGLTVV